MPAGSRRFWPATKKTGLLPTSTYQAAATRCTRSRTESTGPSGEWARWLERFAALRPIWPIPSGLPSDRHPAGPAGRSEISGGRPGSLRQGSGPTSRWSYRYRGGEMPRFPGREDIPSQNYLGHPDAAAAIQQVRQAARAAQQDSGARCRSTPINAVIATAGPGIGPGIRRRAAAVEVPFPRAWPRRSGPEAAAPPEASDLAPPSQNHRGHRARSSETAERGW